MLKGWKQAEVITSTLDVIFKGVLPMVLALLICNLIIMFFPQVATFLPGLMR